MLYEVKPDDTVKGTLFNVGGLFLLLKKVFQVNMGIKLDSEERWTHMCHQ